MYRNNILVNKRQNVKLIYIMGDGRTGSTIVSIILGNHPQIEAVGELFRWSQFKAFPKPGDEKPKDVAYWKEVRLSYFERNGIPDFSHLEDIQGIFENYKNFPKVWLGLTPTSVKEEYLLYITELIASIQKVSDKSIIIDETKRPGRGLTLARCTELDVRIIHLVRDPRGVVYSQLKKDVEHKYKHPITTCFHYMIKNLMSILVQFSLKKGRILRVRYEDVVNGTEDELVRIGQFIGIDMTPVIQKMSYGQSLAVPHLLDGNRIRKNKTIKIRYDDEWRRKLSWGNRWLTNLLTFPLLFWFGYWKIPFIHGKTGFADLFRGKGE